MTTTAKKPRSKGILVDNDWKDMLSAFPKMSVHDQAVIFMLIKSRAAANNDKCRMENRA